MTVTLDADTRHTEAEDAGAGAPRARPWVCRPDIAPRAWREDDALCLGSNGREGCYGGWGRVYAACSVSRAWRAGAARARGPTGDARGGAPAGAGAGAPGRGTRPPTTPPPLPRAMPASG